MLVEAFKSSIFPYLVQIGVISFVFSICQHAYVIFRAPDWQKFVDKMKSAVVAYAVIRGSFVIVTFIDKVLAKM